LAKEKNKDKEGRARRAQIEAAAAREAVVNERATISQLCEVTQVQASLEIANCLRYMCENGSPVSLTV